MEEFMKNYHDNKKKEYIIEKIKLNEKPAMKKYLKEFFHNPKKYFNDNFDSQHVLLGKAKTIMKRYEIPVPKKYQRRFNHKKKTRISRLDYQSLSDQISLINEKRRGFKGTIESSLKEGQRYINDKELEEIFISFQKVYDINKTKINNFITTKELVDSIYIFHNDSPQTKQNKKVSNDSRNKFIKNKNLKNKTSNILLKSKSSLLNSINLDYSSNQFLYFDKNKKNLMKNEEKSLGLKSSLSQYDIKDKNRLIPKLKIPNNPSSNILDDISIKNNYNNAENNSIIYSQNTTIPKSRPKSLLQKIVDKKTSINEDIEKKEIKKVLIENEKLIEKQIQFLPFTNEELMKKEIAKRLATQEKALKYNLKVKKKENRLLDNLSKKLKKQKSSLLLGQIEDYRLIKDIKMKINKLIKKTIPGNNYNWEMDLRNTRNNEEIVTPKYINVDTNYNKKTSFSQNDEITRNPCYKTFYLPNKKYGIKEREYLKGKVGQKLYNKLMKEIKNLKHNYKGFLIEGKNLLQYERDLVKKIKGKKIINNYDNNIQPNEIDNKLYAINLDIQALHKS